MASFGCRGQPTDETLSPDLSIPSDSVRHRCSIGHATCVSQTYSFSKQRSEIRRTAGNENAATPALTTSKLERAAALVVKGEFYSCEWVMNRVWN